MIGTSLCERGREGASQGWDSLVTAAWETHPTSFTRGSVGGALGVPTVALELRDLSGTWAGGWKPVTQGKPA